MTSASSRRDAAAQLHAVRLVVSESRGKVVRKNEYKLILLAIFFVTIICPVQGIADSYSTELTNKTSVIELNIKIKFGGQPAKYFINDIQVGNQIGKENLSCPPNSSCAGPAALMFVAAILSYYMWQEFK